MGRRSFSGLLFAGALCIASAGSATVLDSPLCCVCSSPADTGQAPFCATLETRQQESEAASRCDELGGTLLCLKILNSDAEAALNDDGAATCGALLAKEGINCPILNGAPTASTPALGVLVLAFAAVGLYTVRRRAASAGD